MKNLNVKPYHQAYHPYNIPSNQHHQQQQQQQQHQNQNHQLHQQQQFLNNSHNLNSYTGTARYSNNSYTPASVGNTNSTNSIVTPPPSTTSSAHLQNNTTTPPTLGGYLANQQYLQQQQQQQLRLQQSYNQQHQQQQQQSSPQTQTNMLSLNQNHTYNYNFHFNAMCGVGNNNTNNTSNNNNNTSNNNNNKPYHNSALSRPQRPNSLNLNAMASLATPISGSAYSLPSASATVTAPASSSLTATSGGGSGFPFTPQHFYNQRENIFNFSATNAHNYLQQSFNNYNMQQQHQQQHQQHQQHQHQQQQQQLQQFQLLQQQLKQQHHQQQQQQQQLNNLGENQLTPVSKSSSPPATASGGSNSLTNTGAGAGTGAATVATTNSPTINQSNNNNNTINNNNSTSNSNNNNNNCDRLAMDACEIANFLANELFMQQLVSMECMQTGVPTLTTPTLTPTTLRSIEESFIQLTSEPINAPYQAGFIPPPLASYNATTNNTNATTITATTTGLTSNAVATLNNVYLGDISAGASLPDYGNINDSETEENSQESWNDQNLHEDNSMATTDNSSAATDTASFQNGLNGLGVSNLNNSNSSTTNDFSSVNLAALAVATAAAKMSNSANLNSNTSSSATTKNATPSTTTRRGGGRRPASNANMTPEEEEKRRIRRERNKLAAARCRKRRVDQTNELTDEVNLLERKREELQKQIESLNGTKQDLEFILEAHRPTCQMGPDMLSVNNLGSLMSTSDNDNITGLDTTLSSTARSNSPLDLKPVLNDQLLAQIKPEPLDSTLDSSSSLDGPPSPKKMLLTNHNPMIPPPLPNVATLSASLAAASASLNTPIVTTAPISFGSVFSHNAALQSNLLKPNSKQRPNSLPNVPRNMALNMADNKPPTDINGVAIQTPSTGMFNFDSLMDGGTGLTPVSGPLVPTCSSQNKHPLELVTPTSEPSKLVSL